ncbi:hypothetical protein [Streptococcus oralis]|uniref:Tandem five-TM protein n=1 Tax=Streptococcus oralis TaxID=1303 RepID=A0A428C7K5_STROR|nr:hypothetical protein [Streptococcus oralis]RSI73923.1 hypothetical protein D8858_09220 [Streptococcus oralis]
MKLKFKNSSMMCFQIVQIDKESKKYVMDTSTISPKSYYWGIKTDTITVNMVEIEKNNNQFAIKPRRPVNATMIAIIVQPIVKVSYDALKELFIHNNISEQLLIKLFLFAISMLISYFAILISLKLSHKKADKWIPKNSNKYTVTFTTIKKSNGGVYPFIGLILLCLLFFLCLNNGTEGAFLVINGIVSLFFFMFTLGSFPIAHPYKHGQIEVEKIEKI